MGPTLYSPDELEEGLSEPIIPELKGIYSEYAEEDGLKLFADFLLINTNGRQSWFTNVEDGYSQLRAEIYQIAKALGASEVWYVAELATDEMYAKGFSFDDWTRSFKDGTRYASELTVDVLKDKFICSYYHDDFSDILLERPPLVNQELEDDDNEITLIISLEDDGRIKIEIESYDWDDTVTVFAQTLREAKNQVRHVLAYKQDGKVLNYRFVYENYSLCASFITQYLKALDLASWKHFGQRDKAGKPYFGHIARVSNACKTSPAKVVALLHDVIEDTDVTQEQMEELGFSEYIIKAVLCLTHQKGESYEAFIKGAAKNPIAREVKIAELEDNMDVRRLCGVTEKDFVRMDKYLSAWKYLKSYVK
jgi:hypothetical protein